MNKLTPYTTSTGLKMGSKYNFPTYRHETSPEEIWTQKVLLGIKPQLTERKSVRILFVAALWVFIVTCGLLAIKGVKQ